MNKPAQSVPKYRDPRQAIPARVKDLLKRMTLQEKFAQISAYWKDPIVDEKQEFVPAKAKKAIPHGLGQISDIFRTYTAGDCARTANLIQKWVIENTRLGIPVLIDAECLHGCRCIGAATYPQAIALAATWNPGLIERIATAIGKEARSRGIHKALTPVCDIARDVRAGRTEETYGEDTLLATRMAVAYVKGIQSQGVAATLKHYVANFVGDGGRDSNPIHFSERILREIYLPVFEAPIREAGAMSVMAAYHAHDGTPCTANKWLLTDVLRKEIGFDGYVVSDWFSVALMHELHRTAETKGEAGQQALEAGMEVELPNTDCFKDVPKRIQQKKMSVKVLDEAVRRILTVKFKLGMFDNPFVDEAKAKELCDHPDHRALALEAARQAIVLLKNDGLLPLSQSEISNQKSSIALIGPNAAIGRLGGYSVEGTRVVSPLEAMETRLGDEVEIIHAEGCKLKDPSKEGFPAAIEAAKKAQTVLLFVGNCAFDTEGEGQDRSNLDLPGVQQDLVLEILAANPNTVIILNGGSAITMNAWADKARAIVDIFQAGEETGTAVAEVLFGDVNPSGKLPITFPFTTGQCPLYYNTKPTGRGYEYNDLKGKQARFPFGHGLSYTTFEYENLVVKKSRKAGRPQLAISAEVGNTGKRAGDEVVQLYIHDLYSTLSRPLKELKGFERIHLEPSEKKTVQFTLTADDLSYLGPKMKMIFEAGEFEIMMGSSSEDVRVKETVKV